MTASERKVYRFLTYTFVTVLLCHILLASFIIFNPNKNNLTNLKFEKAYRLFGLTGPFFSEDRISAIPRVYCSIKEKEGSWSSFEQLGKKEFISFHQHYLNYDQFLLSGLPRYLCRQIRIDKDSIGGDKNLQSIKRYIQLSNPKLEIDSAILIYTLDSFVEPKTDTFFVKKIMFDPAPN